MDALQPLADFLKEEIVKALMAQDHNATEALAESIDIQIVSGKDGWGVVGWALSYAGYVNRGRAAGSRRIPVSALLNWMIARNIGADLTDKKRKGLAFAIQKSIEQKGTPPSGGYSEHYSMGNSLKRKGFITDTLKEKEKDISKLVDKALTNIFNYEIQDFVKAWQS